MELADLITELAHLPNAVLRFYVTEDGTRELRVGIESKEEEVLVIAKRPLGNEPVIDVVLEAGEAALAEFKAQDRRRTLRAV